MRGVTISVGLTVYEYLGLVLDSGWNFGLHFCQLAPTLKDDPGALLRLLRKPDTSCLSYGAIALYETPVYKLTTRNIAILRRPQKAMTVRIIRG